MEGTIIFKHCAIISADGLDSTMTNGNVVIHYPTVNNVNENVSPIPKYKIQAIYYSHSIYSYC